MAGLAKGLPVGLIPEQPLVASMRKYMVYFVRPDDSPTLGAYLADRVYLQK
jgi:hypothetical protein